MNVGLLRDAMNDDKVVFLTVEEGDTDTASHVLSEMAGMEDQIVFVTVSKPAMTRKEDLDADGVADDNVFFIDGSKVEDGRVREENVVFVDPANLTDLSISLTQAVEQLTENGPVVLLLDAITALGLYSDEQDFKQFIHVLCNKMRQHGVPVLLIGTDEALDDEMESLVSQFADSTYDWDEED